MLAEGPDIGHINRCGVISQMGPDLTLSGQAANGAVGDGPDAAKLRDAVQAPSAFVGLQIMRHHRQSTRGGCRPLEVRHRAESR